MLWTNFHCLQKCNKYLFVDLLHAFWVHEYPLKNILICFLDKEEAALFVAYNHTKYIVVKQVLCI